MTPQPSHSPLTPDHLAAISAARLRSRKIRRAAGVATLSGATMAFFASITLIGGLFGDLVSILLGLALAANAAVELLGAAKLRRFDPDSPALLGINQCALACVLVLYALYMMWYTNSHPLLGGSGAVGSSGGPQVDQMLADLGGGFGQLAGSLALILYGVLAFLGLLCPGLTAIYYFTRAPLVRRMHAETPEWVIAALRAAG